ncbi:putative MFS transporter [Aspergillus clavatus NRRL 1]|uniref:MFS transporter, putative n=1 Tax=Aspergillus clavatus (strain ATCC 1007 / CBS 513.65 / DSM 816 / NCTC 3887 / NRRL 1 / QM 1276 / 107) TaxID=344612 RepID=A1CCL6_ASPCL|nr:MFS transporter, putative [Aspergillus clavatus NRRL 1]EAW12273.1 MFS transporter, putative [Aspergillus clavatus NRRL 1]
MLTFLKWITLATVANGSLVVGFAPNIYNPAIDAIKSSLHAQDWHISLTLSLFILLSGMFPMPWSLTSELVGRKPVYMVSLAIALGGYIGAAVAKSIGLLIGMRCIQAMGNSSLFSVGAGSLTDIYDVHERGTKFGIYYAAPMLGPSLGPVIGGILTTYLSWRATFWFLAIWIGVTYASVIILMKESFRKDHSSTYQDALAVRKKKIAKRQSQAIDLSSPEGGATHPSSGDKIIVYPSDLRVMKSLKRVIKKRNNVVLLVATGLNYGFTYCISYTCTLTLSDRYHLNALKIGLVLLAYGLGHWVYSPTMSYLLDINPGNTTVTVACNSFFRGLLAFLFAEVAVPLQSAIGDGGLYSLWAGLWAICAVLIMIVYFKGSRWRTSSSSSV